MILGLMTAAQHRAAVEEAVRKHETDALEASRLNGRLRGDIRQLEGQVDRERANNSVLANKVAKLSDELAATYVRNGPRFERHPSHVSTPKLGEAAHVG